MLYAQYTLVDNQPKKIYCLTINRLCKQRLIFLSHIGIDVSHNLYQEQLKCDCALQGWKRNLQKSFFPL